MIVVIGEINLLKHARILSIKENVMSEKATVVCPHCSSTGTYTHGFKTGDGTASFSCHNCHKSFKVHFHKGQPDSVKK